MRRLRAADEKEVSMAGRTYEYARVSTREQNLDRQLDALAAFGVDGVFADKASGRDFERPEWMRLTAALRAGDVPVVKSIDRMGCGCEEIIERWRAITKEVRAEVVVLDMPLLDTREHPPAPGGGHSRRQGARREVRQAEEEAARFLQKHQGKLPRRAYHQVDDGMLHQGVRFRRRECCHKGTGGCGRA